MENKQDKTAYKFGLIGKQIDYSFSRGYFSEKFKTEQLNHSYVNFDLDHISEFKAIFKDSSSIKGLNVTIPYKETILPFLDKVNKRAKKIGAVNTIKITSKGKLIGYNTDYYGFKKSLEPLLKPHHKKALVLGTGGASKAIAYALKKLNIEYYFVSRTKKENVSFIYSELTEKDIKNHQLIINCSPVGTFPDVDVCPKIPYNALEEFHILYDLIYNPFQTKFLKHGVSKNATTINGLKMLELQAEKAWQIWNK